jgi:protein arginine N-methyltransferase 2
MKVQGKSVLNVGFGMGIIDGMIQSERPSHHTIIEAHPDIYSKMVQDGWLIKPNVTVLFGRWQDMLSQLSNYDAIFFDTFGEYYDDLSEFNSYLPNILSYDGIYSYFNGLCGTSLFFHEVACGIVEIDLAECMLSIEYLEVEMCQLGDDVWDGVRRVYWNLDKYKVPIVKFMVEQ